MTNININVNYAPSNNSTLKINFKSDGNVDFNNPPAGYYYSPMIVNDWTTVKWMNLDPRFVTRHKIGNIKLLCYMELTPVSMPNLEQDYKTAINKNARLSRCRIYNSKTGAVIMCPIDSCHKCETCKYRDKVLVNSTAVPFSSLATENENGEIIDYEAPGTHNTEAEAIANINKEEILNDLDALDKEFVKKGHKAKHVTIFNKLNDGMCSADITMDLGIPKATLSGDLKRISNIVINYN